MTDQDQQLIALAHDLRQLAQQAKIRGDDRRPAKC
jgi:hypothetical protein